MSIQKHVAQNTSSLCPTVVWNKRTENPITILYSTLCPKTRHAQSSTDTKNTVHQECWFEAQPTWRQLGYVTLTAEGKQWPNNGLCRCSAQGPYLLLDESDICPIQTMLLYINWRSSRNFLVGNRTVNCVKRHPANSSTGFTPTYVSYQCTATRAWSHV